jgi:tetratricopeptide (TPR) repeat protein
MDDSAKQSGGAEPARRVLAPNPRHREAAAAAAGPHVMKRFAILIVPVVGLLGALAAGQRGALPLAAEDAHRQNNVGVARLERYDFAAAATAFRRALELEPTLGLARVNLAIALLYGGDPAAAIAAADEAIKALPASLTAHYVRGLAARLNNRGDDAIAAFRRVLQGDPSDVGSRIQLAQELSARQQFAEAIRLFDEAVRTEPFNATATYGLAMALARSGERERGAEMLKRFEQLRTNLASITYSSTYLEQGRYGEAVVATGLEPGLVDPAVPAVAFTDATTQLLGANVEARGITLFDADADGDLDLALTATGRVRLRRNVQGRLTAQAADVAVPNEEVNAAVAGDFNNDGLPDLFVLTSGGGRLLQQAKPGVWRDASAGASLPPVKPSPAAGWGDVDHDGDLDIITAAPQFIRNNGKGSFADATVNAALGAVPAALAVVPTDYDRRRDLDLLFVPSGGGLALLGNARDGTFRNVTSTAGLTGTERYRAIAAGDVNKDGITDFFVARAGGVGRFALSDTAGRFRLVDGPAGAADVSAAMLVDYDNDGVLDLLALRPTGPGIWRNTGSEWVDVSARALPAGLRIDGDTAVALATGDVDGDGDTDAIVRFTSGRVRAWRNDGPSQRSVTVRLTPRVSNRSAIGASVEIRAGSLRQRIETMATTPPAASADIVFGLGTRRTADAVRVLWPAGILQAETTVATPTVTIVELNRKPSSCPFLYTWNGSRFEFVSDFMGGGEMGAWVGPGQWNVADPDEYVRIRPDQLRARNGQYELRVTNELEEAVFIDRLNLVAIAHPDEVDVYPNEGLRTPGERKPFAITAIRQPRSPRRVLDHHGHDVSERAAALDRKFVDDFKLEPIQGYAEEHWVTIDLGLEPPETRAALLLTGWTDYSFSSDNVAAHQAGVPFRLPSLQIKDASGKWATAMPEIGLPVGRPQTVVVDVTPLIARGVREVRISTTLRVYWDQIQIAAAPVSPFSRHDIEANVADLKWRGFSEEVSSDGREPYGYDYSRVSHEAPWKMMPGRYTREGDVRALLSAVDDHFVVGAPGDDIALSFDAATVPPPPPGWTTTFFLFVDGFSKEMNLHSGSPDQVEPLPFHAMSGYPYAPPEHYPDTPAHRRYRDTYNTRIIGRSLPAGQK